MQWVLRHLDGTELPYATEQAARAALALRPDAEEWIACESWNDD